MVDPRRIIGSIVTAKACHITSLAECARRYGSNKSTKTLDGVVTEVVVVLNDKNNRTTTNIIADYSFGDCIKRASLNIRCIKAKQSVSIDETMIEEEKEEQAAVEIRMINHVDEANDNPLNMAAAYPTSPSTTSLSATSLGEMGNRQVVENTRQNNNTIDDINATDDNVINNTTQEIIANDTRNDIIAAPNGERWYKDDAATLMDINGSFPFRSWGVKTPIGDLLGSGSNVGERLSRLEVFLLMFPPQQLETILVATNLQLMENNKIATTKGEILKFFGVVLLATKFEFKSRAGLWSSSPPSKYENAPSFGKTGMARTRFDDIWRYIRWGSQPKVRPEGMSSKNFAGCWLMSL
jgi:Transposase IS4